MGTEDFTTFTKAGAQQGRLTTTADRATWTGLLRSDEAYLYKDYDIGHFTGEFTFDFDLRFSDVEAGDASNRPFVDVLVIDNVVGDEPNQSADAISVRPKQSGSTDDKFWFRLGVAGGSDDNLVIRSIDTTYYCRLYRNGANNVKLSVYSDAARTNLIFTLGTRSSAAAYRYILTGVSMDHTEDPNDHSTGYIEYLDLDPFALQDSSKSLPGEFIGRHTGTLDLAAGFEVSQGSEDLYGEFVSRQSASQDLSAGFDGQTSVDFHGEFIARHEASVDLYAGFEVGQGSVDFLGKFTVRQDVIVDLLSEFDVRLMASVDLLGEFIARHEASVDLLGKFIIHELIGSVDLLGEFAIRQEASIDLNASFVVGQGINDLKALLCIPKSYDFSKSLGISFYWWGSGGVDQQIDFEMESPTGSWVGKFYDGPAEWRWVFLSWDDLTEVDLDGTRPNGSQITGIFWTYHTPGVRRIDGIQAWMRQDLPARFVVRHEVSGELRGCTGITHSVDLNCEFNVSP